MRVKKTTNLLFLVEVKLFKFCFIKIENILKSIESYKLCGNILFVGGNPPKKAVFPTIKRELKKRCTPPNQVI